MKIKSKPPTLTDLNASQTALRDFFHTTQAWGLTSVQEQILLGTSGSTFFNWKAGNVHTILEQVVFERISHVLRIYAALKILLPIPERAHTWVKTENMAHLFGCTCALDRMLTGQVGDIEAVAYYLETQLGGSIIQQPIHPGNCVERWNELHDRIGSFADDHTTI